MRFAAIDFETATWARNSACSLGICLVDGGSIEAQKTWLIQPPGNRYESFNTSLHGIGPSDTKNAPAFIDVISQALELVGDLPLVAHNAAFDMSVLRNEFDPLDREYPCVDYYCTMLLSRAHWPDLPGYSLPIVLARCGASHRHHDSGEDAWAAAQVLLRIAADAKNDSIEGLAKALGVRAGHLDDWGYTPCHGPAARSSSDKSFKISSIKAADNAAPDHPFYDADIAFTGTLISMTRPAAMQLVADRGGRPRTSVSKLTEYLVVGSVEYKSLLTGEPSRKMREALELKGDGCPIVVLSEQEFLEYL